MRRVLRVFAIRLALSAFAFACGERAPAATSPTPPAPSSPAPSVPAPPVASAAGQAAGSFAERPNPVRFAVIGDNGNNSREEYEVGDQMTRLHQKFSFDFVVMMGDNLYGSERPQDFVTKFEQPYKVLLDAGVKFYAAIGNHDDPNQRFYKPFNMEGERYYSYTKGPVQFFVLDSNYMDSKQLAWLERVLKDSSSDWKICYLHHPLYSSGKTHGSEVDLRQLVEPLFVKYGVNVVLAGHEHFYERIRPQQGIAYFISGAAGQLRPGDIRSTALTAVGYDKNQSFMLIQIAGDEMAFQALSRTGEVIDSGVIQRQPNPKPSS